MCSVLQKTFQQPARPAEVVPGVGTGRRAARRKAVCARHRMLECLHDAHARHQGRVVSHTEPQSAKARSLGHMGSMFRYRRKRAGITVDKLKKHEAARKIPTQCVGTYPYKTVEAMITMKRFDLDIIRVTKYSTCSQNFADHHLTTADHCPGNLSPSMLFLSRGSNPNCSLTHLT